MNERYDLAIIGSGPAGLSAALNAQIRKKKFIIFGTNELSGKLTKAEKINNYLGFYVNFGKPLKGEEQFLGKGVGYCATCDAPLYKDKIITIIAYNKHDEDEANFMGTIASKVYYIPMYKEDVEVDDSIEVVFDIPKEIHGDNRVEKLILKNSEIITDGIFILRDSVSPGQLVPGLEMDGNSVKVDRKMQSNLKGCFAAGDIVGAPYQYIKAAGEGNIAALSAVSYIDNLYI